MAELDVRDPEELDEIPGICETRKKTLLRHFGSVAKVKNATAEELASVRGMSKKSAEAIVAFYKNRTSASSEDTVLQKAQRETA